MPLQSLGDESVTAAIPSLSASGAASATAPAPADSDASKPAKMPNAEAGADSHALLLLTAACVLRKAANSCTWCIEATLWQNGSMIACTCLP